MIIFASCEGDTIYVDPDPDPTPTPGYSEIRCVDIYCYGLSQNNNFKIKVVSVYQNYGNEEGSAQAIMWVEQPPGSVVGTFTIPISLYPGENRVIEHIFPQPTWSGGEVLCYCDVY